MKIARKTAVAPPCGYGTWFAVWLGMTMVTLGSEQRRVLIDKVPDAANIIVGALSVGQFVSDRSFSFSLAVFGLLIWIALMGLVLIVAGMEERR